jgi:AraC family transcriptional regulator
MAFGPEERARDSRDPRRVRPAGKPRDRTPGRLFAAPGLRIHKSREWRLDRVVEYIEAHLADALSLEEMSAIACFSRFHFSRCFKRSMGVSPHRYVVQRRIDRSRLLLEQSNLPLVEIAISVGFDSQSSFSACFYREVGISPGRFRRERV